MGSGWTPPETISNKRETMDNPSKVIVPKSGGVEVFNASTGRGVRLSSSGEFDTFINFYK